MACLHQRWIRTTLARRREGDLLSLCGPQTDGRADRLGAAVRSARASVPNTSWRGCHPKPYPLRALARWQAILGEHAQRRSVARLHHRGAELDGGVEEMSLSARAKLPPRRNPRAQPSEAGAAK